MITVNFTEVGPSVTQRAVAGDLVTFYGDAGVVLRTRSGIPVTGGNFVHTGPDDSYFMECIVVGEQGVSVGHFSVDRGV